jgi:hypothetical protein
MMNEQEVGGTSKGWQQAMQGVTAARGGSKRCTGWQQQGLVAKGGTWVVLVWARISDIGARGGSINGWMDGINSRSGARGGSSRSAIWVASVQGMAVAMDGISKGWHKQGVAARGGLSKRLQRVGCNSSGVEGGSRVVSSSKGWHQQGTKGGRVAGWHEQGVA